MRASLTLFSSLLVLLSATPSSAQPLQEKYRLVIGNRDALTSLNDDPSFLDLARPYLFFQYTGEEWKTWVVVAGLYNQVEAQYTFSSQAGVFAAAKTLLTIAGDGPRIDGVSFDAFEFSAHQLGGSTGFYVYPAQGFRLKTGYDLSYYTPYSKPAAVAFTSPNDFWESKLFARLRYGRGRPPSELYFRGFSASLYTAYSHRHGNTSWGPVGSERKVNQYFSGSLGAAYSQPFERWLHATVRLQGSYISKADRINALQSGSVSQNVNKLFLRDIKSDRAFVGDAGLRFHILGENQLALKPFASVAVYREITPTRFRNDFVAGPAIKALGQLANNDFLWDITYGAGFGHRPDLNGLHDLKINFSYRF